MTETFRAQALHPDRLELGEGIRWTDVGIFLVDILAGRLLHAPEEPDTPLRELARLPFPLGAVAPVAGRPGTWIAAAGTGICLLTPDGSTDWLARPEDDAPLPMRMNDATADPSGRFWAGSMAYGADEGAGSLYRVDHDGTVSRVLDGISVPNGPVFTADGTGMYLADSARGIVRRYPVDPATGELGDPETFVTVAEGSPDGMTVDGEGAVWMAVWGTGTVRRYLPDGSLDRTVRLPARQPAGVCLREDVLYVTTARVGLTDPGPDDGALFAVRVEVPGRPADAYRPVTGVSRSEAGASRPVTGVSRPEADASRPVTDASRPETDVYRSEAGAARPEAGAARPEAGAARPEVDASRSEAASKPEVA